MNTSVELSTGTTVAVETTGSGDPLLLIQGMSGHLAMWGDAFISDLARTFEVITFDHRGVGTSSPATENFTVTDLATDAAALLEALGHESAHVMGISMGGMVAQELTLSFPKRARSLVLGCTTPGGPEAFDAPGPGLMVEAIQTRDPAVATRVGFDVNVSPEFAAREGEYERFRRISLSRRVPAAVVAMQAVACLQHDARERLAQIDVPTSVVHGSADLMISPREGERLAALMPGAEFSRWEGVGHLLWWERPVETAELVRATALKAG